MRSSLEDLITVSRLLSEGPWLGLKGPLARCLTRFCWEFIAGCYSAASKADRSRPPFSPCWPLPHIMPLGSKSNNFKRQELRVDGLSRPGPRNKHIIFAWLFWSSCHSLPWFKWRRCGVLCWKKCQRNVPPSLTCLSKERLREGSHERSKGIRSCHTGSLSRSPWLDNVLLFFVYPAPYLCSEGVIRKKTTTRNAWDVEEYLSSQ